MLLTNIDHWDLFTISEERYLLFPRFKKDYSISIKDLYYHKGRNYILQLRNNTENIKNIRFNVIPYFKHLRNSHYMFMPCWNLYSHRPITSHQLTLEITGISFLEDLFCKFIDLGINTTPLINLYPSGFCDGIRIDRSTIIGKRFDDLCDFKIKGNEKQVYVKSHYKVNYYHCKDNEIHKIEPERSALTKEEEEINAKDKNEECI